MGRQSIHYAAFRSQLPTPAFAAASGGTLAADSLYLSIIPLNREGLGRPSTPQQLTWTNNQKIQIPLPAKASGEEIHRILIAGSASNDASTLQPLCWWRGYSLNPLGNGYFEEVANTLPATIELSHPNHVALGAVVPNPAGLTALTNLLDGMTRWVTSLSQLFYYDAASSATANGSTVIASSSTGKWLPWIFPSTFGVGTITDLTGERGALRDVRSLTDADILFPPPAYAMDGSVGPGVTYWIANGTTESGTDIEAGQRLTLEVSQGGLPRSQLFDRRIVGEVLGVARISDGTLSTSGITTAQHDYVYGQPLYTLEQNLLPGRAIALKVSLRFRQAELDGYLQGSGVEIKPYFSPQAGSYVSGYRLWGDIIYSIGNRRRVFPRQGGFVRVGDGSGLIQRFEFDLKPLVDLPMGGTSLSNQKITVNSNGDVFQRGTATNDATEVTRAIVTMASGRSNASTQSGYVAATAGQALSVTVPYPTAIRSDLGDVLAGEPIADGMTELNPPFVVLYVQRQSDSQIREFVSNAVLAGSSQVFTLTDFTTGTVIGSIPAAVGGNFGFWASATAPTVAIAVSAGSLAADSYRVSWAFRYDGSTASSITHSVEAGCVPEMDQPISELFSQIAALEATIEGWQNGSANLDVLAATIRGAMTARGALNFWADLLTLNQDAAQSGADWRYGIQRPSTGMSANQTLTLPPTAGIKEQAIVGDGTGVTQYASVIRNLTITLNHNSANPLSWFTLPANASLRLIEVRIVTAFNGSTPVVSLGITLDNTKYIASAALDLKATAGSLFRIPVRLAPPASDEALILTYTASSSTAGQAVFIAHLFA